MVWYAWVVVTTTILSTLLTIGNIGKPREPITPALAVAVVVANSLIVWAVVALAS